MTPEQMGRFICTLRKEQGLTQKALAGRLQITDKAVSKWERGISCPDISLLPALAAALGVTSNELLSGARDTAPPASVCPAEGAPACAAQAAPAQDAALSFPEHPAEDAPACIVQPAEKAPGIAPLVSERAVPPLSESRSAPAPAFFSDNMPCPASAPVQPARRRLCISPALRKRCALGWSLLLFIAVGVCLICDLATTGGLGWSLYPAASCLLAGCVTLPLIRRGAKGIRAALLRLTLLIGPFLAATDWVLARSDPRAPVSILPIGFAAALPGLLFLWGCFAAASLFRGRPLRVGAACAGLAAAACLAVNALLAPLLNTRLLDVWDWLVMFLLAVVAAALLWLDECAAARR